MPTGETINYQGNAALAQGGSETAGPYSVPDMSGIVSTMDKLGYYQFLENRDRWAQKNLEADNQAKLDAEMSAFKLSDWAIEGDRTQVLSAIDDFNKYFADHPGASKLRTDAKTGKVMNHDEYVELQAKRNNVLNLINRANTRTSKYNSIREQTEALTNPYQRRNAEAWLQMQTKKGINEDLIAFPNLDILDRSKIVARTESPEVELIVGNEKRKFTYTLPSINEAVSMYQMQMTQPENETLSSGITSDLDNDKKLIARALAENPNLKDGDDQALIDHIAQMGPMGQTFAQKYRTHNKTKAEIDDAISKGISTVQSPDKINLRNLGIGDELAMIISANSETNKKTGIDAWDMPLREATLAETTRHNKAGEAIDRGQLAVQQARLAWEKSGGGSGGTKKPSAATMAKLDFVTTVGNYALNNPNKSVRGVSQDILKAGVDAGQKASDLFLGNVVGRKPGETMYSYKLPDNEQMRNVFQRGLEGEVANTDLGVTGQKNMEMLGAYLVTDKDLNPDNNKYVIYYKDPRTGGKVQTQVMDNATMMSAASGIYGKGGTEQRQVDEDYFEFLRNYGLGYKPALSELNATLYGYGGGGQHATQVFTTADNQQLSYWQLRSAGYSEQDIQTLLNQKKLR